MTASSRELLGGTQAFVDELFAQVVRDAKPGDADAKVDVRLEADNDVTRAGYVVRFEPTGDAFRVSVLVRDFDRGKTGCRVVAVQRARAATSAAVAAASFAPVIDAIQSAHALAPPLDDDGPLGEPREHHGVRTTFDAVVFVLGAVSCVLSNRC